MRYLSGTEEENAVHYLLMAASVALDSKCLRSKCGSLIVQDGEVIGKGFNSPPQNRTLEFCLKDFLPKDFPSDKTCCIHAEQRAVANALVLNAEKLAGSTLYFVRLDETGRIAKAGKPYCTICSKLALDAEIDYWVLWHEKGLCIYDAYEYNEISFGRKEWH